MAKFPRSFTYLPLKTQSFCVNDAFTHTKSCLKSPVSSKCLSPSALILLSTMFTASILDQRFNSQIMVGACLWHLHFFAKFYRTKTSVRLT